MPIRLKTALLWLALLGLAELLLWQVNQIQRSRELQHLAQRATDARAVLEAELNTGVYLTIGIESFLQSQNGHINEQGMRAWMNNLFAKGRHLRNIGLAPDNRLSLIFPLAGNEAALGLYYPDLPDQWPAVQQMIEQRKPILDGPLQLAQGGLGLIYRRPVYIDERYWGLISTVMDARSLLDALTQYAASNHYSVQLSRQVGDDPHSWQPFWGEVPFTHPLRHSLVLDLPGANWRMVVSQPADGSVSLLWRLTAWLVVGLLLTIIWQYDQARIRQRDIEARNDALKRAFVATVSHELRTPLTAIQGALGLLQGGAGGSLPEPAHKLLNLARQNTQRLGLLINDLLDMEKLANGKLRLDCQWQALWPILEQAVSENEHYAVHKHVQFVLSPPDPFVKVNVDRSRLLQVLANLLSNGAKFSPQQGRVTLSAHRVTGGVEIQVSDQGAGVPVSFRPHLFEKFAQADPSDSRQHGGTGLGLAIAKELVEKMGGRLRYQPADPGSVFIIRLDAIQIDSRQP